MQTLAELRESLRKERMTLEALITEAEASDTYGPGENVDLDDQKELVLYMALALIDRMFSEGERT